MATPPKQVREPADGQSVKDVTPPADETPPYYIADKALFVNHVRAFNPGDHVPVDHVTTYGWSEHVHAPQNPPETDEGQATTTERKGDA